MNEPRIVSQQVGDEIKVWVVVEKCPVCGGEWKYYHGMLGYESMQCGNCHFDINEIKAVVK